MRGSAPIPAGKIISQDTAFFDAAPRSIVLSPNLRFGVPVYSAPPTQVLKISLGKDEKALCKSRAGCQDPKEMLPAPFRCGMVKMRIADALTEPPFHDSITAYVRIQTEKVAEYED
jgi:hypothetical protein